MEGRISYVKKPWAKHSIEGFLVGLAASGLWVSALWLAVRTNGEVPLYGAAMTLCGVIMAIAGLVLSIMAMFDKDKKYLFAKIGLVLGSLVIAATVAMTVSGMV